MICGVVVMFVLGCATPYQQAGMFRSGYDDHQVDANTFVVTFKDQASLGRPCAKKVIMRKPSKVALTLAGCEDEEDIRERLHTYALRRAAELTLSHGFSHFVIVKEPAGQRFVNWWSKGNAKTTMRDRIMIRCYDGNPKSLIDIVDAKDYVQSHPL